MVVQWYPGHMNKAKNQVQESMKLVDIVIEILDARLPKSSQNPMIDDILGDKNKIVVLNKSDLADEIQSKLWVNYFAEQGITAITFDAQHTNSVNKLTQAINKKMAKKIEKYQNSGVKNYRIKAMCVGIPNVGKSTILNRFAGKNIAVTGNKPGVTKNQNWIKTSHNIDILDTPGILWPKIDDQEVGLKLALTGAIKDSIYNSDDVSLYAIDFLKNYYPQSFKKAYKLDDSDLASDNPDLLMYLTKKFGFKDDYDRGSDKIIIDTRKGVFGKYTLDRAEEQ